VVIAVAGLNDELQQVQNKETRSMNTQPSKENIFNEKTIIFSNLIILQNWTTGQSNDDY